MTRRNKKRRHNPHQHLTPLSAETVERVLYGTALPDMHTEKRLAESRKEVPHMPSLQEALQAAVQRNQQAALTQIIDAWEDDEPLPQPQPEPQPQEKQAMKKPPSRITNNVSRDTFDFIRANPGLTRREICDKLMAQGHKHSSVTSLVSQLHRTSQIERRGDKFYAIMTEYTPINQVAMRRKLKQQKKQAKQVSTMPLPPLTLLDPTPHPAGLAALQPAAAPASAPVVISNDVEHILNTLPIKQARTLYDELHKVFGSK